MNKPKILSFDIETSPNVSYTWGKYEQNVIDFEREWNLLSFAYRWHGEKKVQFKGLPDYTGYKKDRFNDLQLTKDLWELLDEADIVIAHNGDAFDIKRTNARFLFHGLGAPSSFRSIDTLKMARKYFKLNSNKLTDIGQHLGLGEKVDTGGFELWLGCMNGEKKSWKLMEKYNKQDVVLLDKVYQALSMFEVQKQLISRFDKNDPRCTNVKCGSKNIHKRGIGLNMSSKYQRYQCQKCGRWTKGESVTDK